MILFIYFLVYFLLVFVIRSLLLWKNTGINPITFSKKDDAHGFNGKVFKWLMFMDYIVINVINDFEVSTINRNIAMN